MRSACILKKNLEWSQMFADRLAQAIVNAVVNGEMPDGNSA